MPPPLIALRDVGLIDAPGMLFEHVDLALMGGDRACLVGRNGAGKSTLLRLLAGEVAPDVGERAVTGSPTIALVAQEPRFEGEDLLAAAERAGLPRHAAEAAFEAFGLDSRKPALSGGERRRAALAQAFAADPDILLLDEPTNHLDILAVQALEARLAGRRGGMLIVSHDRAFLRRVTNVCLWLEDGTVRRLNEGFAAFEAWAETVEAQKAQAARRLDVAMARDERWLARGVTARRARNEGRTRRLEQLRAQKAERLSRGGRGLRIGVEEADRSGRLVVEARAVAKAFAGRRVLENVSTRILRGERVAIVGPNGSGKTTLVRILSGELEPDAGTVRRGANLALAYMDQDRAELAAGLTLREALAPGGGDQANAPGGPRHVAAYARDFLFRDGQLDQDVASLSGGERNRLMLARALATPSNLLVLDEPTNDLDMETLEAVEGLIADYEGAVVVVSHDRDFIDRVATSTIALNGSGGFVETPGGWSDFVRQNPTFLSPGSASRRPRPKTAAPRPKRFAAPGLSFSETRRLAELEAKMPRMARDIVALEASLADPDLYARDLADFTKTSAALVRVKAELAAAEDEWLALEHRREEIDSGRKDG